jgi:rhodanese-related sulfurtransferase/rubrerythrin
MKWLQYLTPVKSVDFNETKSMIDQAQGDGVILLDVRQPKEYQQAHIPGATLIPLPELGDRLDEVDRDNPVLIYCATGGRSRVAAQMMAGNGFKNIYNVAGGIKAWKAGKAVGPPDLGMDLFEGKQSPEEILKTAYSLEEGLRDFYLSMSEEAPAAEIKSLFLKLSEIEVKHQESIVEAYQGLGHPEVTLQDFSGMVEEKAMEGGMTTREYLDRFNPDLSSAVDVISLAMSIEAQALDLYHRVGAQLTDAAARSIVLKIADEEKAHLESLGKLMDSL